MSLIGYIRAGLAWLWRSKARLGLMVVVALLSAFLIFPYDDLSDLVSAQVSALSRNTVFLQFERLKLSLFPQAGVKLDQVYVEAASMPGLSVTELTITPSVSALIAQKPHGRVNAKGLLKGDLDVSVGGGGTSERGAELTKLEVTAEKMSLQDIRQLANLPVLLKGQLDMQTQGTLDLTFSEQPDMDLTVKISKFELPPANMQTPMGDISVPEMRLSGVELKGKLSAGRFLIENARIGSAGDDLQGTIKGSINMNLRNVGAGPTPEFGAYSLEIDLQPSAGFKSRASFILSLLSSFQTGERYRFKVAGQGFYGPPTMSPLR